MASIDIYSWDEVDALCQKLASSIDESFDALVCVLRGGAVPGAILANALKIDLVLGIKVVQGGQTDSNGQGDGQYRAQDGEILVPLNDVSLRGLSVLVVDDVLDSGESIRVVVDEVRARGAAEAKVATMQVKTYSNMTPDYFVEVKQNWLFYPWMSERELEEMKAALGGDAG